MRRLLTFFAALILVAIVVACGDSKRNSVAPTGPQLPGKASLQVAPPRTCTTLAGLKSLARQVFNYGEDDLENVLESLDEMDEQLRENHATQAQVRARTLVAFIQAKVAAHRITASQTVVNQLIGNILCYAGLDPNTFLIQPNDQPQVVVGQTGTAGVSLPANPVTVPTLLTIQILDPNGPAPLVTKLDKYPGYVQLTSSAPLAPGVKVVVEVCPSASVPPDVRARLVLGHQKSSNPSSSAGFEILPPPPSPSFLDCSGVASSQSRVPGWLKAVASLILPRPLYARMRAAGGVGGVASEFSPFGPVDPELRAAGGVGGTGSEFQTRPTLGDVLPSTPSPKGKLAATLSLTPGAAVGQLDVNGNCISNFDGTVGAALDAACRPRLTVKTAQGTILTGVPVGWAIDQTAASVGTTAADDPVTRVCGAFGATASNTTNANGKAGACWTLGAAVGLNKLTATPSAGGDAPPGVTFNPPNVAFTGTASKITPTAGAVGATAVFDGLGHPGSGTCSNGLVPVLTYDGGAVPNGVGSYTLTVTCGAGSAIYNTVSASATIAISLFTPVVAVSCPASVVYTGNAQTPCSATVSAPGLSETPTPAYSANTNVGTATASVNRAAGGNYAAATGSAQFQITPAPTVTAVACPSSLVFTGSALTPCTATVTGPGSLNLSPSPTYGANLNVGTATASYTYAGGGNYQGSADSKTFTISAAATVTAVSCPASQLFANAPLTPCTVTVTGPGGLSLSPNPTYGSNTNVGTATAAYTFAAAGNYLGSADSKTFQILAAAASVSLSCPLSVPYTGVSQTPCAATVSGPGLSQSVPVVYVPSPANSAGTYGATASYPSGGNYIGSSSAASFSINRRAASATAGSGAMSLGGSVPSLPCTMGGVLAIGEIVTCTTKAPALLVAGVNVTTPLVSPSAPANYNVTLVNGSLTVRYVQSGCFASPIQASLPPTSTYVRKGNSVSVRCKLVDALGRVVQNATGNLLVQDKGTDGLGAPATAFSGTNIFTLSREDDDSRSEGTYYKYTLGTSAAAFVTGHYYLLTATWSDGSTTTGWFYIRQ